ncbi:unnamed protein product [Linum trigynum]|uniref:MATH domain-containing protein n=1 Tax=Linum trigynum TaxID=586398 RepID=A0AAV2DDI8_9ROSI
MQYLTLFSWVLASVEMATVAKGQAVMRKETNKFTWKIDKFSELKQATYSDAFSSGAQQWKVCVFPKGNNVVDKMSAYLHHVGSHQKMADGWSVLANFTLAVFSKINPEVAASSEPVAYAKPKVIKTNDQPQSAAIKASSTTPLSKHNSKVAISTPAKNQTGATTTSVVSPPSVQSTSKNLIAKLASVTSSSAGHGSYTSDPDHGTELLPQQWEKLDGFLDMTLEAISRAKSLDEVEDAATKIAAHATDPVEKTVLQEVLARLAEFKDMVPSSLSAIETSHAVESSGAEITRAAEVRLVHRKKQLSALEAEVSRLQDEDLKLESEIKQLADRKAKIVDHMKSTAAELDRANREASKELDEFEKQHDEIKEAVENRMRAMERLAQGNASWKLFKKNLRR